MRMSDALKEWLRTVWHDLGSLKEKRGKTGEHRFSQKSLNEQTAQTELDNYHEYFTRINQLIDEITRSKAFRVAGDAMIELISGYMSYIRDNNSNVEKLMDDFRKADDTMKESLLQYMFSVNGRMLGYETELKAEFERIRELHGTETEEKTGRKRRTAANLPEDPRITMFFNGCDTRDKLDKRYKNLAKTYHPDMDSGDTETMALINQEYERLKDFLGQ